MEAIVEEIVHGVQSEASDNAAEAGLCTINSLIVLFDKQGQTGHRTEVIIKSDTHIYIQKNGQTGK